MVLNHKLRYTNISFYVNAGKKKSYIRHLADKLNIPYDNRAVPGSGLAHQIYLLEQDLANGNIEDSDLIIIGITSKDRVLSFSDADPHTILLSYPNTYPNFLKEHEYAFLNYWNDQTISFHNLMLYQYLLNLAKEKLKNQLYFVFCDSNVQTLNYDWPGMTELPDTFKLGMSRLQEEFINSNFVLCQESIYFNWTESDVHGGNHLKEIVHKRFAEKIYNGLISKNLL